MIEVFKEFTFEAAHQLAANVEPDHPYANLHGHSFKVEVFFRGEKNKDTGWIADFALLESALEPVKTSLDHKYLNSIDGLELPTMENIAEWIFEKVAKQVPEVHRVVLRRGSCGEGCIYLSDGA